MFPVSRRGGRGSEEEWILGIQEIHIPLAFRERKLPPYSISFWSCLILSRYNSIPALPFCEVTLKAQRPLPPAYPKALKPFGDHLKKKRLDLKLLQGDVAQKLGVNKTSIHNWERGSATPSLFFMPRILKFVGYIPFVIETASPAEKIKPYRRIVGLTQKALAKQLKIDPTTLARWERGKGQPPKEFLTGLNQFFASLPLCLSKVE